MAPSRHISRKSCLNLPYFDYKIPLGRHTKAGILNFSLNDQIAMKKWDEKMTKLLNIQ